MCMLGGTHPVAGRTPSRPSARVRKPVPGRTSRRRVKRTASARTTRSRRRTPRDPGAFRVLMQHMAYSSHDVDQVRRFYTETLGFADFSVKEDQQYLSIQTGPSSSLGFMPPHPDMRGGDAAPREPGLYFMVEDVDRAYEHLLAKGVRFARPPQIMPWGHRVLTTTDPEGRMVMIAGEVEPED